MTSIALPGIAEDTGLARYLKEIHAFPMLTREDEYMLARRWREYGDAEAAHKLVTSHLRLVAKIAGQYRGYGLPLMDLISEGNIGLMQAVKRYDPDRGFRLATYAMWWIRASVLDFILRSWSLVKLGSSAFRKRLFFNLQRTRARLNILTGGELSPAEAAALARELDVPPDEVIAANRRLAAPDVSLNGAAGSGDGSGELMDTLVADGPTPEEIVAEHEEHARRHDIVEKALSVLSPRDRHIFIERRLRDDPATLAELSAIYGVSRERIRQLEERAFKKVRAAIADMAPPQHGGIEFERP